MVRKKGARYDKEMGAEDLGCKIEDPPFDSFEEGKYKGEIQ